MDVGDLVAKLKVDRSGVRPALVAAEADAARHGDRAGGRFGDGFGKSSLGRIVSSLGKLDVAANAVGTRAGKLLATGVAAGARKVVADVDAISDRLKSIGKVGAIAGAAGGLIALAAASSQASGALVALPAAGFMAAGALATVKIGTAGVSDALSALASGDAGKAAEALAKLSPAARAFAVAADGVRKSYKGLQQGVQEKLFAGFAADVTALGRDYLPILDAGLGGIATRLNLAGGAMLDAARSTEVMSAVTGVLAGTGPIVGNLVGTVTNLGVSLLMVAQAGMPLLDQFTQWIANGAGAAAAFLSSAEGAAWLASKVELARVVLSQLGAIVGNVGSLVGSMFSSAQGSGMQLLDTLVQLTARAAAWASSAQGQQQLVALFSLLSQVLTGMLPIIGFVGSAIMTLSSFLASMPAPVQSAVTGFLSFALVAGLILPKIVGLVTGLRTVVGALGSVAGPVVAAAGRWGLLGKAAGTAATATDATALKIVGAMGRAAVGMMARAVVMAASWLIAMGPIGWLVAAVIAAVALIVLNWDKVKAALVAVGQFFMALPGMVGAALAWLGSAIAAGASAAWNFLTSTASAAVNAAIAFVMGLPGMVAFALGYLAGMVYNGAMAAWRFLSETLPMAIDAALAWLAALPGRVVAFLVMLGSAIASGALAAWNWLLTTTVSVGSAVIAWVAALPGRIGAFIMALPGILRNAASSAWNGFLSTTKSLAQSALAFIQALPGRIRGFFSSAGTWLVAAGRQIIQGLWNGLKAMAQGVLNYIKDLGKRVADGFKAAVGIRSPSKVFADHGINIGKGLVVGLDRVTPDVLAGTRALAGNASAAAGNAVRRSNGAGASATAEAGLLNLSPASIEALADAVAGRPVHLDGRRVSNQLDAVKARERRLVTTTRR